MYEDFEAAVFLRGKKCVPDDGALAEQMRFRIRGACSAQYLSGIEFGERFFSRRDHRERSVKRLGDRTCRPKSQGRAPRDVWRHFSNAFNSFRMVGLSALCGRASDFEGTFNFPLMFSTCSLSKRPIHSTEKSLISDFSRGH